MFVAPIAKARYKYDIAVPDITSWAWPCARYNLDVVAAERCKIEQVKGTPCNLCPHKDRGRNFVHIYNDANDTAELGDGLIICRFSQARYRTLNKCPLKISQPADGSKCKFKATIIAGNRPVRYCFYDNF